MNKWFWILLLCGISILSSGLFLLYTIQKEKKRKRNYGSVWTAGALAKRKTHPKLLIFYQKAYVKLQRVPLFQSQIRRIRKKLSAVNTYDEYTLRKETMRITFLSLGLILLALVVLAVFSRSWLAIFFGILIAVVVNGLFMDLFVNRIEDKLLKQFSLFLEDNRHAYQELRMVDESIYQAAQASPHEIKLQVEKIHEILTSNEPQKGLEKYYAVAPNRYLKVFSGISHLILEYGDRNLQKGSMYLNSINKLVQEIRYDLLRRQRLRYKLGGLTLISLAPILISFPLKRWAERYFPITEDFYQGRIGYLIQLSIYAVAIISYVLIRKLAENDEAKYVARSVRRQWEKKVYRWPLIKWLVDRLVPAPHTRQHFRLSLLLKEANSRLTLEWFYLHRLLISAGCFLGVLVLSLFLHWNAVHHVWTDPTKDKINVLGYMSDKETQQARELTKSDNAILKDLEKTKDVSRDTVVQRVQEVDGQTLRDADLNNTVNRILDKLGTLNSEYLRWWELLAAIAVGAVGYGLPLWILQFQRRMRALEMQNEVDQFHVLISILSEFERISVESVLEWMERYGIIFKPAIQRALLTFDSGAEEALKTLQQEAPFEPFERIVRRLLQGVEKISIHEAFDDLEMEQEYYAEQKKERLERLIRKKASWGKMLGWTPGALLIALYLVFPFLYMSFGQLSDLSTQIQTI
ncbi:hypothetical protein AWM70_12630 [Paenibacillus yonginensis]|uniref:Uncharacterized protein n=1 Tax=Paenibacillus yonginensis TaxID=1462996 RepID=A0A1B1N1R1_9BACL|nr:hypothetical protein [Paenibacillus yonginensis]ANS75349.1 hypothetical protein AWM70_12630 [Paenibacillus yonginensis]